MIITISDEASGDERGQLMALLYRIGGADCPLACVEMDGREVIAADTGRFDAQARALLAAERAVERVQVVQAAYQLVSRAFKAGQSRVVVGDSHECERVEIGAGAAPVVMAGPCAVEDRGQLLATARAVKEAGATMLRGGAFKPRTSPYQFQGLGVEGLHLLAEAREETGLPVITEVMEAEMVEMVAEYADVLQIGSRNMQNFPLLRAVGQVAQKRPVLLKRGLSATIEEWLLAAEYIVAAGNPHVMLCERGIRSYDQQTRNVLDLSCVPLLHELTHLPVIVDPSHATGKRELVPTMSRASIAAGAEGLIIEVHPDPDKALCDGRQSITPRELAGIVRGAQALGRMMRDEMLVA